jgi:predicted nucleic acid-binding protein
MFLLDTNVVSEIRKAASGRADPQVLRWAGSVPASQMFISVVTVQELEIGILLAERRDPAQGALLRVWLETQVLPGFADRILNIDTVLARRSAALHVPDPRPFRDGLIAATGLVHRMTVVTRNVRDFEPMGVAVLNPWDGAVAL